MHDNQLSNVLSDLEYLLGVKHDHEQEGDAEHQEIEVSVLFKMWQGDFLNELEGFFQFDGGASLSTPKLKEVDILLLADWLGMDGAYY